MCIRLLDCRVITTEYRNTCPLYTYVTPICNAFVDVIYSGVAGQCSHTIHM